MLAASPTRSSVESGGFRPSGAGIIHPARSSAWLGDQPITCGSFRGRAPRCGAFWGDHVPCRCSQDASDRSALRPAGRHERQHGECWAWCWASPGGAWSPPKSQPAGLGLGRPCQCELCQCQAGAAPALDLPGSSSCLSEDYSQRRALSSSVLLPALQPFRYPLLLGQRHGAKRGRGEPSPSPSPCLLAVPLALPAQCRAAQCLPTALLLFFNIWKRLSMAGGGVCSSAWGQLLLNSHPARGERVGAPASQRFSHLHPFWEPAGGRGT